MPELAVGASVVIIVGLCLLLVITLVQRGRVLKGAYEQGQAYVEDGKQQGQAYLSEARTEADAERESGRRDAAELRRQGELQGQEYMDSGRRIGHRFISDASNFGLTARQLVGSESNLSLRDAEGSGDDIPPTGSEQEEDVDHE